MLQQLQLDQPYRLINNISTLISIASTLRRRNPFGITAFTILTDIHLRVSATVLRKITNLIKPLKVTMLITAYIINLISQRLVKPNQNKLITR